MTGFPRYPKVECSYENFHKPKRHKVKRQLPLTDMKKMFLSISRPEKERILGFSGMLGRLTLTDAQNKAR